MDNILPYNNIIEAIGHTPLVELSFGEGHPSTCYAKLEMQNMFGMKDRVGRQAVLDALAAGVLKPGGRIIESSSGTMALGLGMVGTFLGHPVHIVTDARTDRMTIAKLEAIGCTVEIVTEMGSNGWQSTRLDRLADLLADDPEAFCPHQYENPSNPAAYSSLATELTDELGRVDILVASVGSGGSISGTARALRRASPDLHVVAVDAVGSVIFEQPDIPGRLQGGHGNSVVPLNVDMGEIDEVHWLSDAECFAATLALANREKIFAGNSSGCVYAVMDWIRRSVPRAVNIVGIFPDRGDRYYHSVYNSDFRRSRGVDAGVLPANPQLVEYGTTVDRWSYAQIMRDAASANG